MITLFGATGYTGRKITMALADQELPFRIAGRSADKLARLAADLPGSPEWLVADATQPGTLPPLFAGTRVLINAAGPFTDLGEQVAVQAAENGVHYLDLTNELGFAFRLRSYDGLARQNGAALVPACAFEVALADCLAALVGDNDGGNTGAIEKIHVVYDIRGSGSSAGTRRSALRTLATARIAYRDGRWTETQPSGQVKAFDLTGGRRWAFAFPSCEMVTIPTHLPARQVEVWMAAGQAARWLAPVGIPLAARLSRGWLRGLMLRLAAAGGMQPEDARPGLRGDAPYTIEVFMSGQGWERHGTLSGSDPYGVTAEIAVYAARKMMGPEFAHSGLLAPAQALDPGELIDYAQKHWKVRAEYG